MLGSEVPLNSRLEHLEVAARSMDRSDPVAHAARAEIRVIENSIATPDGDPQALFDRAEAHRVLIDALRTIPAREAFVVAYRNGLLDGTTHTRTETARALAAQPGERSEPLSAQRIKELESHGLSRLRYGDRSAEVRELF